MPIAGRMSFRAAFRRPREADDGAGNVVDGFVAAFTVWAEWKRQGARTLAAGGVNHDAIGAQIEVRDSGQARTIRAGWRVDIKGATEATGRSYHVTSVGPPDRETGGIAIMIEDRQGGF